MYNILIIEDDDKLSELVKKHLEKYDYNVTEINDFKNIEEQISSLNPDLVLLDINIPYYDGFYLCRIIRRTSKIPVIIISARSSVMEQVMAMELGADDYITKPFELELLLAKIKATFRRSKGEFISDRQCCLRVKGLSLDSHNFKVSLADKSSELTKNEYKLIKVFLENPDQFIKREVLLSEIWDENAFVDENTLNVNVTRVKNKLKELGINDAIKTKRGVGYLFDTSTLTGDKNA